ncbi:PEP-CTERM sorting domain-containing protein [Duganella sp. FT80W]|uniref:PEP-CTERM sorting domain-containing protein n=1 Tax=Duganella guangzhouensis TaxID=2666084 RepID=A0A6I2L353_9BURK|nr:PEP-CTERM sorting domain-containing protein [Duganella guangzhouensis]MRW92293.1 PEP-CTERM sorting domain-containing protein [Duganella guangzhouensis]
MKTISRFSVIAITWALASTASAALTTGSQNVSGSRTTPAYGDANLKDNAGNSGPFGPYSWNYSYTRSFDGDKMVKDIQIKFSFDADLNYSDTQKSDYIKKVEAGVEGIWDNKYAIKDNATGKLIPILVDVTTDGPFNQNVQVHAGAGRSDMLNWYVGDGASVNAHEVGHMMGLYDEYIGGAVNQYPNPTLSNDGLMGLGALNANPTMYARYYQQYYDYMKELNPDSSIILTSVPEPSELLMMSLGLAMLGLYATKRKT